MINFGSTIKTYRQKIQKTQVQLAQALGVESTYLSAVENGRKEPSLNLLKKIAKEIRIPPEILLWESVAINQKMKDEDRKIIELAKTLARHYLRCA